MGQENRDKVLNLVTETRPSQPNKSVRRIVSIQEIVIYVQPTHTIRRVVQTLTRGEPVVIEHVVQAPVAPAAEVAQPRGPEQLIHPYQGYTMHLAALQRGHRTRQGDDQPTEYLNGYVTISQNGQPIRQVGFRDLEDAGYTIRFHSLTVISLEFKGFDVGYVVSGLPQVSLAGKTLDKQTGG